IDVACWPMRVFNTCRARGETSLGTARRRAGEGAAGFGVAARPGSEQSARRETETSVERMASILPRFDARHRAAPPLAPHRRVRGPLLRAADRLVVDGDLVDPDLLRLGEVVHPPAEPEAGEGRHREAGVLAWAASEER